MLLLYHAAGKFSNGFSLVNRPRQGYNKKERSVLPAAFAAKLTKGAPP